jgi:membrane protease YdiL (CAAX protease family)
MEMPGPDPPPVFPRVPMARAAARADIAVVLAVLLLFVALPPALAPALRPRPGATPAGFWYLWAIAGGVVTLAAVRARLRRRGQDRTAVGLGPVPGTRVLLATLAAVPLCYLAGALATTLVAALSPGGLAGLARQKSQFLQALATIPPSLVLPVSLFVGLYEEVLFRGFLLGRLRALSGGALVPVAVTTALFGILHFPQGVAGVAQTAAIGLVLALVVVRTGTLWPAILAHATIDTVSLTLTLLLAERLSAGG